MLHLSIHPQKSQFYGPKPHQIRRMHVELQHRLQRLQRSFLSHLPQNPVPQEPHLPDKRHFCRQFIFALKPLRCRRIKRRAVAFFPDLVIALLKRDEQLLQRDRLNQLFLATFNSTT